MIRRAAALLVCTAAALAQTAPPPEPEFAIEVTQADNDTSPMYTELRRGEEQRQLIRARKPDGGALELAYQDSADVVVVTATVIFGSTRNWPGLDSSNREVPVGKYALRLGERTQIPELVDFGLPAVTIEVMRPRKMTKIRPAIQSKVPSLRVEITGGNFRGWYLTIRNVSANPVTGFCLSAPRPDASSSRCDDGGNKPLITPGATLDTQFDSGSANVSTIVLESAVFADGTFEGEPVSAASIAAQHTGMRVQKERIDVFVKSVLEDTAQDDATKIARLRAELSKLAQQPETDLIDTELARFGLKENYRTHIAQFLKTGLADEKQLALRACDAVEKIAAEQPGMKSLAEWWALLMNR